MTQKKLQVADKDRLVQAASEVMKRSYSPYSNYQVGAALLAKSGEVFVGTNVENVSYSLTYCAERSAVVTAVSEGIRDFTAIAVVTKDGGQPCGACRQFLYEFNPEMTVIIADSSGNIKRETILSELLPDGFGPRSFA